VTATIGQTTFEQESEAGGIQQFQSRDFLVRTAELILDSEVTLPQAGDQIRETVDTKVFVYEVMAPGSQPAFR
ncbi:MAG: hypothetical protein GY773_23720, partial [Actinomycetia bacterium]|nr:hypothetical protein [Actinomycetes bacterium]